VTTTESTCKILARHEAHLRALRSFALIQPIADRQGGVITWEQNEKACREAGYTTTIAGWMKAAGMPCVQKANGLQRHPPLRVTQVMREWAERHQSCDEAAD
jgi:hypothetical protein